ncbi:MAG: IMP dehydrogenase, partial [Gammaproteobacteria bacterium]|nr:IMP dehydrogenase [Gammaproteobacteria bacterium]
GEWYSGEELPRWRLGCFMRADGRPLWKNPELLGWRRRRPMAIQADDVRLFAETLAGALRISPGFVMAAHEDGLHQLWANRLGSGWIPSPDDLRDPERRRTVAACLSTRHGEPAGYVLPLRWDRVRQQWASGRWSFRRDGLFLIPGKSPLGFRLPIESLPAGDIGPLEAEHERCQTEERSLLPEHCGELSARYSTLGPSDVVMPDADGPDAPDRPPRTALALELRDGQLYVFIPPLTHLEHYLDLIGAVEATARETGIAVMFEGYEPPDDHRLRRLVLEPEPGVLKVWLPDSLGWTVSAELVATTYGEAERLGLRAERIIGEGRRVPPGGGAELILGGESPGDSPFLHRPELLRALIVYWQRHPSLSYLFAGRLVGPDGPAPRPDEGRDDALYELALALDRIPSGEGVRPWVPDRLLRHLLADPAGNMKRAEIRMDLLYAPDRPSMRLGKTVLRSFEAVPDARSAGLQSLLVVTLLAALARKPEVGPLINWGDALHDRFMLPRLLWEDFRAILADLAAAGYPLQDEWFRPIVDQRFPILGSTQLGDVTVELRTAHEPWPLPA